MCKNTKPDGTKLWDEILKAIVDSMPEQLFPLFKEVYGKDYPKGSPTALLATESSTYQENTNAPPSSRLSDITLLVNCMDYYHLECQTHNEPEMVIRMVAYDLHFAMQHTTSKVKSSNEITMHFPHSLVIYLEKNQQIPSFLRCRIIFQDGSEHIYQVPTVKVQSYSLEEIHEKHLNVLIPYVLLRLRPKLKPDVKHPLTKKELTEFVDKVIFILTDELNNGYLTRREFDDYINLFRFAADRIFKNEKHAKYREEVDRMTKPLIELPSVREKRLRAENNALRAEKDAALAEKDAVLAENEAVLAENARMKELLNQYNIAIV